MKEEDIRPKEIFDELLRLIREDIPIYFEKSNYSKIDCPACNSGGEFAFCKDGFIFEVCKKCKTLYVSFRPDKDSLERYYTSSNFMKYFASDFYKQTQENRRELLWKQKAELILNSIKSITNDDYSLIDIGGGYGIFIEEFLKLHQVKHCIIEPSEHLSSVCMEKGLNVIKKFMEELDLSDLPKGKKVFVSFELFEHLHSPSSFLKFLYDIMSDSDIFIFTTLNGKGLDISVLWENSKIIAPPAHLNFFNPSSISTLLQNIGFSVLDISTPGKLDIDILSNSKEKIKDRFWKNFIEESQEEDKSKMQKFISENSLSSHMMIVAKK